VGKKSGSGNHGVNGLTFGGGPTAVDSVETRKVNRNYTTI